MKIEASFAFTNKNRMFAENLAQCLKHSSMKKKIIWISFTIICLFVGCLQKTKQNTFNNLSICDVNKIRETRTINLSEWVEDFRIVRFENSDIAYFVLSRLQ